jgi:glycosyltransferase involved in cell wall biosynthesis
VADPAGAPPSIALLAQDAYVNKSGIARYQLELLRGLASRVDLHVLAFRKLLEQFPGRALPPEITRAKLHFYSAPSKWVRYAPALAGRVVKNRDVLGGGVAATFLNVSSRLLAGAYIDGQSFALVHGTSSYLPRLKRPVKRVVTVHDVTPITLPQHHTRTTKRGFLKQSDLKLEDDVVFDARSGMDDFLKVMDHPRDRCHVIWLGVDHEVFRPRVPEDGPLAAAAPYIVSVGTIEPRKNLVRGLQAFETLAKRHEGLRWKVAGPKLWGWPEFSKALEKSPARDRVDVLGPVPDAQIAKLYRGARALLYPTLWEGFGLPVLEALACGAPVAASDVPVLQEIAADAFVPIDPTNVNSIVEAVEKAAFDEYAAGARRNAGIVCASQFKWSRTVDAVLSLYAKALGTTVDDLQPLP